MLNFDIPSTEKKPDQNQRDLTSEWSKAGEQFADNWGSMTIREDDEVLSSEDSPKEIEELAKNLLEARDPKVQAENRDAKTYDILRSLGLDAKAIMEKETGASSDLAFESAGLEVTDLPESMSESPEVAERLNDVGEAFMEEASAGLAKAEAEGDREGFLSRLSGKAKSVMAAASLATLASMFPSQEAEAKGFFDVDVKDVISKEIGKGAKDASRDTGKAIGGAVEDAVGSFRRGIGLETPQERRSREREEAREEAKIQREQERAVKETQKTVEKYVKQVEQERRSYNAKFEKITGSYAKDMLSIEKNSKLDAGQKEVQKNLRESSYRQERLSLDQTTMNALDSANRSLLNLHLEPSNTSLEMIKKIGEDARNQMSRLEELKAAGSVSGEVNPLSIESSAGNGK